MKKISVIVEELADQVSAATDPKNPLRLPAYKKAYRDNIGFLIPTLKEDPTIAALAIHGLTRVVNENPVLAVIGRDKAWISDWEKVKPAVRATEEAREVIKKLEEAELQVVIVAAVVANHILKHSEPQTVERTEADGQETNASSYSEA